MISRTDVLMPTIDESIKKIDSVICRHFDEIENSSRGAISQDILEQLTKLSKCRGNLSMLCNTSIP